MRAGGRPRRRFPWAAWLRRMAAVVVVLALAFAVAVFRTGYAPFTAVASSSMEPVLHRGDLVWLAPVDPTALTVGDVVVVAVPGYIQSRYDYPPLLVHRVSTVDTSTGRPLYRLKGDRNQGEDPFTVRPEDVRGRVGEVVPYAGYPILFFASRQGMLFVAICALLYALYLALEWWERRREHIQAAVRGYVLPAVREALDERGVGGLAAGDRVEASLQSFAAAMAQYALHLQSHTAAVEDLARGALGLREAVEYQVQLLSALYDLVARGAEGGNPAAGPGRGGEAGGALASVARARAADLRPADPDEAPLAPAAARDVPAVGLPSRRARRRAAHELARRRRVRRALALVRAIALFALLGLVLVLG